jgi:hypothetical protein
MMMMEPEHHAHVEYALGRRLTDEELVAVADLASLPPSHLTVIEQIYRRDPFAAIRYLRAVTNDDDPSAVRNFVHGFDSVIAQRDGRTGSITQRYYERELGHALTPEAMSYATSLQSISDAQREVTRDLARKDRDVARSYLHCLVPDASWEELHVFLESLPCPR